MKQRLFKILQYVFFLALGGFLIWWQLHSMSATEKERFIESLKTANYWLLLPVTIASLISHLARSLRWKLLMEPLSFNPALKNIFAATMVGYLANSVLPRFGEILKCSLLGKYEKLNVSKLIGTIIVERLFDFICFILLIGITVFIQLKEVGAYFSKQLNQFKNEEQQIAGKWAFILIAITIVYFATRFIFKKYPALNFFQKIKSFLHGLSEGIKTIRNLQKRKAFLAYTLLMWGMYLLQIYIGFFAMPETSALSIKASFSVLTLATLAMIITPGGIGSFPIFVMQTLMLYQIAGPVGEAFGWMIWGTSTGIIFISGMLSLVALPYMNKNNRRAQNA